MSAAKKRILYFFNLIMFMGLVTALQTVGYGVLYGALAMVFSEKSLAALTTVFVCSAPVAILLSHALESVRINVRK